jgi:lysophospholipase L1-like esterase
MALAAGCGSSTGPLPMGPSIVCPASIAASSPTGQSVTILYQAPVATGGSAPVAVTCAPPSGSTFPIGSTQVACIATDARGASASCAFAIVVAGPPRLSATRFLSFGDSLTLGTTSVPSIRFLEEMPDSYPFKLQRLLAQRYTAQSVAVLNDGVGGEMASSPTLHSPGGDVRLPQSVDTHRPEVVLLMEGTNDLQALNPVDALESLEGMVRNARARGARVFLATIPPQKPGFRTNPASMALVPGFNDQIRALATREGATLVEVYNGMRNRLDLIGADGLHPVPQGYDLMAQIFFDTIRASLETQGLAFP